MCIETLYLIRHGHINTGSEKRYIGSTNLPLDELGKEQVKALSRFLLSEHLDAIYSSPLVRCIQTTDAICRYHGLSYTLLDDLREIHMGDWENKTIASIKETYPKAYEERGINIEYFTPPHGENFAMLSKRVIKAFNHIEQTNAKHIAIVAHAGVNRVLLSHLLGRRLNDLFSIEQPYGSITPLHYDSDTKLWNKGKVFTLK